MSNKEGRGFFLFSAINGLFERARSSAEKESQRLFTGSVDKPGPESILAKPDGSQRKRKSAPLTGALKHRPRPSRNHMQPSASYRLSSRSSSPIRASSAMSDRTHLAATVDTLALEDTNGLSPVSEIDSALPRPASAVKRKREDEQQLPVAPKAETPKRPRPSNASLVSALPAPGLSSRSSSTAVSTALAATAATAIDTQNGGLNIDTASADTSVERNRLEKVERELHRLKKIIASLLPEELNDDDLRSVYGGELEQLPRQASDDVILRLIKARFGSQLPTPVSLEPPKSTTLPPAPPLPPSLDALNAAHKNAASAAAASAALRTRRPVGMRSIRETGSVSQIRRASGDSSASKPSDSSKAADGSSRKDASKPAPPKPPHRDPGVMSQLLEEMKHHKLRPVAKPKDMR
ncbi:hypothetical protein EV183_004442 [Coemansia sp. RSA 2336]|nr:hypothetical protein EV183_004442 [Coemansia sp. RSA 2336]